MVSSAGRVNDPPPVVLFKQHLILSETAITCGPMASKSPKVQQWWNAP